MIKSHDTVSGAEKRRRCFRLWLQMHLCLQHVYFQLYCQRYCEQYGVYMVYIALIKVCQKQIPTADLKMIPV